MAERQKPPFRATYRVQLHEGFTFRDAAAIVDYLAALGFSHLYCSPIMQARPGSTHGYDVVDPNALNPELGSEADFSALVTRLHAHDMGLLLDIVPNHVGVGPDNERWLDVLEWGAISPFAGFFDIDWRSSQRRTEGKLLLPILGDQFGRVLENGDLALGFNAAEGSFHVRYGAMSLPVSPLDYPGLLKAGGPALEPVAERFRALAKFKTESAKLRQCASDAKRELATLLRDHIETAAAIDTALAAYAGQKGDLASWRALGQLIDRQNYRPAYWRVAADEINYRRFFDINDLAGIRVELPEVFEQTHRATFRLLEDGLIDGVRIDHIDGLFDPKAYAERLQARRGDPERPLYVLVEKILAHHEELRDDWPVAGTTGYDTINQLTALFNDPAGERALTTVYRRFSGRRESFDEILYQCKLLIVRANLASEVGVLTNEIHRVSSAHWRSRDFTLNGLRRALEEVIASFPVYRTYVDQAGATDTDRRYIDWAIGVARGRSALADQSVFDFLHGVLTGDLADDPDTSRADVLFLAMRFQQLSGPVMAKGLEDTSFYRYARLLALNEVGGDPRRFYLTPPGFHRTNENRLKRHPADMLAGSTHDTKRGEDARARLVCLSGVAGDWQQRVTAWQRFNRRLKIDLDGTAAPDRNDEYYYYQSLLGCWPPGLSPDDATGLGALADRLCEAMLKAVREAKEKSSWSSPSERYEQALTGFVRGTLDTGRAKLFLADFQPFASRVARLGALTSLSQTLLRLAMPGVPDIYRGSERGDLSLVDPDNRRPVDYTACRAALESLGAVNAPSAALARKAAERWADGTCKLALIRQILDLRRLHPALFGDGSYTPLAATGVQADRIVAFVRGLAGLTVAVIAPRFWPSLLPESRATPDWRDTAIVLPPGRYTDCMTGLNWAGETSLVLSELLAHFPVGLLFSAGP